MIATPPAPLTWRQLLILLVGRFVLNTTFRIAYPLLAFLAAGFAVNLTTASLLVTVQVGATLASPLGGTLADSRGERATMGWGLGLFCAGALQCALAAGFWPFLLGYALIGLGTALYQPSAQAYASARTPYERRGRVLGFLELSWALAALLGVTVLAQLANAAGSVSPAFWALLVAGVAVLLATLLGLPDGARHAGREPVARRVLRLELLSQPAVAGMLLFLLCCMASVELVFVVYAGWLEADFGATTEQLALVFGLIGFAELAGSGGSALLVDRVGKRRAVLWGFVATALFEALLPLSAGSWALFLPLFLLFDLCFEFAIVSSFPLISGIAPLARGTVMSLGVAAVGLGRVFGSLVGTPLWQRWGFAANGLLACALALLGVAVCTLLVREGEGARGVVPALVAKKGEHEGISPS
jgi:predicted MFS family arabinose efflux permease